MILRQRAALDCSTFPVNPFLFRVKGPCRAAIMECRMIHGILLVLQDMFVKMYLLKKGYLRRHLELP